MWLPSRRLTIPGSAQRAPTCGAGSRQTWTTSRWRHPQLNRYEKRGHDAAEWLPAQNQCWFATVIIAVRREYGLTIDRREADALDAVLRGCE